MANYEISAIKGLRDQLLYVPEKARREQARRVEKLIREIHLERPYPYDYVFFRITRFRAEHSVNANFLGSALRRDLLRLLLDLSGSVNIPVSEAGEPVLSLQDVAQRYRVSARTVARWQASGLLGQKFIFPDAQKQTGFKQSSLDQYIRQNPICLPKLRAFSRMTGEEKAQIIQRARALASESNLPLSAISLRLSEEFCRSRETIRYTIRNFDRRHPDSPVLGSFRRRLSEGDKRTIKTLYEQGTPVRSLSASYRRTPAAIYFLINRVQARELLAEPIEYVHNPAFDRPDADEAILGKDLRRRARKPARKLSLAELADAPPYLRHLYETPLLTREQERALFLRYNYCKYKMARLREQLAPSNPSGTLVRRILRLRRRALALKNEIISANLRLVVNIARRHAGPLTSMSQLISDGNMCLLRAVEKFDCSRGNRLSTYATWALIKNFAKTVPEENYHLNRFLTGSEDALKAAGSNTPEPFESAEDPSAAIRQKVLSVLKQLSKREQEVIRSRFGLADEERPKTLDQIGAAFGVTRERVRQIEVRALTKLRKLLESRVSRD